VEDKRQHQKAQQNIPSLIPASICHCFSAVREWRLAIPRIFRSREHVNAEAVIWLNIGSAMDAIGRTIDGVSGDYGELVSDHKSP
jgi:hypothetical protein